MKINFVYCLMLMLLVVLGCQKEVSFETGNKLSDGSLQSEITGDCLPKTINGTYEATKVLIPATNTIVVGVTVVQPGAYIISTDTVNGYFFRATGTFTTAGNNTITLRGTGTPFAAGVNNFVVSYDSTVCDIQVTVFPAGAGGPAVGRGRQPGGDVELRGACPGSLQLAAVARVYPVPRERQVGASRSGLPRREHLVDRDPALLEGVGAAGEIEAPDSRGPLRGRLCRRVQTILEVAAPQVQRARVVRPQAFHVMHLEILLAHVVHHAMQVR